MNKTNWIGPALGAIALLVNVPIGLLLLLAWPTLGWVFSLMAAEGLKFYRDAIKQEGVFFLIFAILLIGCFGPLIYLVFSEEDKENFAKLLNSNKKIDVRSPFVGLQTPWVVSEFVTPEAQAKTREDLDKAGQTKAKVPAKPRKKKKDLDAMDERLASLGDK